MLYFCNDANMNVTAVVDTSGNVVQRFEYTAYGEVTELDPDFTSYTGSDYDVQILFAGYRFDSDVGLYHVRHRVYHPTLGRWLTRDPAGYADGFNLSEYVRSSPVVGLDPVGLEGLYGPEGEVFEWGEECRYQPIPIGQYGPEGVDVTGMMGIINKYGPKGPWIDKETNKHIVARKWAFVEAEVEWECKCVEGELGDYYFFEGWIRRRKAKVYGHGGLSCSAECSQVFYAGVNVRQTQEEVVGGEGGSNVSTNERWVFRPGAMSSDSLIMMGVRYTGVCPPGYAPLDVEAKKEKCKAMLDVQCDGLSSKWRQEVADEVRKKGLGWDPALI